MVQTYMVRIEVSLDDQGKMRWRLDAIDAAGNVTAAGEGPSLDEAARALAEDLEP